MMKQMDKLELAILTNGFATVTVATLNSLLLSAAPLAINLNDS